MTTLEQCSKVAVGGCMVLILTGLSWAISYSRTGNAIMATIMTAGGVSMLSSLILLTNIYFGMPDSKNPIFALIACVAVSIMTILLFFIEVA